MGRGRHWRWKRFAGKLGKWLKANWLNVTIAAATARWTWKGLMWFRMLGRKAGEGGAAAWQWLGWLGEGAARRGVRSYQ